MNKPGIINLSAAGLLLALACDEPLPAQPSQWRLATAIPDAYANFTPMTMGPAGLYAIDSYNKKLVVYDGKKFRVDYDPPGEFDSVSSVGFWGDVGWLTGRQTESEEGPWETFLIKYGGGKWNEERQTFPNINNIYYITPLGRDGFYCIATVAGFPQISYIAKYSNGSLKIFYALGETQTFAYAKDARVVFGLSYGEEGRRRLFASGDGGASWRLENIALPPPYEIEDITDFKASPDALYIMSELRAEEQTWYAIIKRTGVPGEGVYELSYLGAVGPGRFQLYECAFRAAADGLAVGWSATMRYDGALWTAEFCGEYESYEGLTADPRGGFWAVTPSGDGLYWHP